MKMNGMNERYLVIFRDVVHHSSWPLIGLSVI